MDIGVEGKFLMLVEDGPRSNWMEPGQGVPLTRTVMRHSSPLQT